MTKDTQAPRACVFLMIGEESFLIEEAINQLRAGLGEDGWSNFSAYHGDENPRVEHILEECNTLPFFGASRLVLIRAVHKLPAKEMARLVHYAKDPAGTTRLVLAAEGQTSKSMEGLVKQFSLPSVHIQRFDPLKGPALTGWIHARAAAAGKQIERDAAALLAEATAGHTWFMASEIEKLCLYTGSRPSITRADVEFLVMRSHEATIFAFQDALFDRKRSALGLLVELEQSGLEALELIAVLANQIVDHYKLFFGQGWKWRPIHGFVEKKISARRKLWNAAELQELLSRVRGVEQAIKSGRADLPFVCLSEITARFVLARAKAA